MAKTLASKTSKIDESAEVHPSLALETHDDHTPVPTGDIPAAVVADEPVAAASLLPDEIAPPPAAAAEAAELGAEPEAAPDADTGTVAADEADADEYRAAGDAADEAGDEPGADETGADETGEDEAAVPVPSAFAELGLSEPLLLAIAEMGYLTPTPIQQQAIPIVLMGRDVLGVAQTGTGKTAGFTLPMLDILSGSRARARMPRSLILEPTRELALQVAENFVKYGKHLKLNHALLIGGESVSDQKEVLNRGVDVLIATPGRLIDMFERGGMLLTDCRVLVIDEADRMLDMGFIPDVERIVAMLPHNRQTLFFSATMAPEIKRLADAFLQNPREVTVSRSASVAATIITGLGLVAEQDKREALRRLLRAEDVTSALIFCNRKRDVDILFKSLTRHQFSVGALHGDMAQPVRFATLEKFKAGEIKLLCCSDVAARGIDIGGLSHVFNFDVPHHAEDYVHRIGRTGRAGREGHAFTLATPEDRLAVEAIEKLTGHPIPRIAVEGLDPVTWSESVSRGRRRGAAPVRARAGRSPAPARDPEAARDAPRSAPRGRSRAADRDTPRDAARDAAPRDVASRDVASRDVASRDPALRDMAPASRPERQPRPSRAPEPRSREYGRDHGREDEGGPRIIGFGDEVPAFMRLRRREGQAPAPLDESETAIMEEADA